jgi:flagellin-like protein
MKKGISSLVGVVLLVGIVVTIAIILLNFFDVFSQNQADNIENESLEREYCSNVPVGLKDICAFDDGVPVLFPGLKIEFENLGSRDIDRIQLIFYNDSIPYQSPIIDYPGIVKNGFIRKELNDIENGDIIEKIAVIKYLTTDDGIGIICEADIIELNSYPNAC